MVHNEEEGSDAPNYAELADSFIDAWADKEFSKSKDGDNVLHLTPQEDLQVAQAMALVSIAQSLERIGAIQPKLAFFLEAMDVFKAEVEEDMAEAAAKEGKPSRAERRRRKRRGEEGAG